MNNGQIVLSQLLNFLPVRRFQTCVNRYGGNVRIRNFSCRDQFVTMFFAQLAFRESLRGIEASLNYSPISLYHMGFRCHKISRNTLAKANENRNWKIYADFANILIAMARKL